MMISPGSRTYSSKSDLKKMANLLPRVRPVDWILDYPSANDLHELMALKDVQANTRLWLDDQGNCIAFGLVDHFQNLLFEINAPELKNSIFSEIVDWGEKCLLAKMDFEAAPLTLDSVCRQENRERILLLVSKGFIQDEITTYRYSRSLLEPIPEPTLPSDFLIRAVKGEEEAEALVSLHRSAFGTDNMSLEERLAMMRVPGYDIDLDLVAVTYDGQLAGYCVAGFDPEANIPERLKQATIDPIAVSPEFQRMGLAKALIFTAMQRLKEKGAEVAAFGTSSGNQAMQRTAVSAGFTISARMLWFTKSVEGHG